MKQTISLLVILILVFSVLSPAFATGDGNIEGGGGGMGGGSSTSYWNGGDDGVRVTVITKEGRPATVPIDFTNINASRIEYSFGKISKLSYVNGASLTPQGGVYAYKKPDVGMPRIISTSANKASIEKIKKYFCSEYMARRIAEITGVDYDKLVGGDYKLLLEPIAYFHFKGLFFAMTATEAALYNKSCNGALRASMVSLTSKNLPLAMFLETADIGFLAYVGATSAAQSDDTIISSLGLGIVTFKEKPDEPVVDTNANYVYRTDTDVITSITLSNNGSDDVSPDKGCEVEFNILGQTYRKPFICPSGSKQLIWVKWHTPSTPQMVNISVRGVGFGLSTTITADIVKLVENTPPDPQYADSNKKFKLERTPDYGSNTTATWSQWFATWVPPLTKFDVGHWEWFSETYTVTLDVDFSLSPDTRVRTAEENSDGWEMKSGYGINADSKTSIYTFGSPNFSADYTQAQTEMATFSDFGFATYNRLLEPEDSSRLTSWHFKKNINSYYGCLAHFTPLWYPDNTDYVVAASVYDVWTPVGMLYTTVSDSVKINGNVYDDWYIRLTK